MMNANVSLKNNRGMLSKRRQKSALTGLSANRELKEFPKATEALILAIKEKMQKENRKAKVKQICLFVLVVIVILIAFWSLLK